MVGWAALTKSYDDWGPILMSWSCVCLPVGVPPTPHPRNLLRVFLYWTGTLARLFGTKIRCSCENVRSLTFSAILWYSRF
jgi:hypothetical protein